MKFYFNDGGCFDILEKILHQEKIFFKYDYYYDKDESEEVYWGPVNVQVSYNKIRRLIVDTDLEHYDFIKFLLKKELKKEKQKDEMLERLENCYNLTKGNKKISDKPLVNESSSGTFTICFHPFEQGK